VGLGAADYLDARRDGFSEDDLRAYLHQHGLRVVELEFLRDWWTEADVRGMRLEEDMLLHLAGLTGAEQINAGLFDQVPDDVIAAGFRRLCRRAAEHGLRVGLEFMPYSALRTLDHARAIVEASGADNAGLILDAWHWHRAGADLDALLALRDVPVVSVQIGDALADPLPDLRLEGRHHRLLPGQGAVDLPGFLSALEEAGIRAPLSVEVLSDDLDRLSPGDACAAVARATREVLTAWRCAPGQRRAGWSASRGSCAQRRSSA
jgi:sugar phosphate isomerase/epimerase